MRIQSITYPLLLIIIMLFTACTPPELPVSTPHEVENTESHLTLQGQSWRLTTLYGEQVLARTTITAEFGHDGIVSGSSGCNRYNAPYKVNGSSLTIGMGTGTMMACPEPVMEQERAYLAALDDTRSYEISGETLSLKNEAGSTAATLEFVSQDLAGTAWTVLAYNNGKEAVVSVMAETDVTAAFGDDGQMSGSSGCNNYTGPYETDDNNVISMGPFGLSRMACPEPVMEQEGQYLAALESASVYKTEGDNMEMRTVDGSMAATFQRVAVPTNTDEESEGEACIGGTVTFSGDQNIPEGAITKVQLNDTSLADVPAVTVAEQIIPDAGSFPIAYEICYDPTEIQEGRTYTMRARIEDSNGKLLYINDTAIPVITRGNATDDVEIPVIKVGG